MNKRKQKTKLNRFTKNKKDYDDLKEGKVGKRRKKWKKRSIGAEGK